MTSILCESFQVAELDVAYAAHLCRWENEFPDGLGLCSDMIFDFAAAQARLVIAHEDDSLLGLAVFIPRYASESDNSCVACELRYVYVKPEARSRGVLRGLVGEAPSPRIFLYVGTENPAVMVYKALGFTEKASLPNNFYPYAVQDPTSVSKYSDGLLMANYKGHYGTAVRVDYS